MQQRRKRLRLRVHSQYRVLDRDGLAEVVREAVATEHDGNLLKASRSVGGCPSVAQLSRIRGSKPQGRITNKTTEGLRRLVGIHLRKRLDECVLSPSAQGMLEEYHEWVASALRPFATKYGFVQLTARLEGLGGLARAGEIIAEGGVAKGRAKLGRMSLIVRAAIRHLGPWASQEVVLRRSLLAWARVIEPLLGERRPGRPDWRAMPRADMEDFVDAGVSRELLLLQGPGPIESAQDWRPDKFVWLGALDESLRRLAEPDSIALYRLEKGKRRPHSSR